MATSFGVTRLQWKAGKQGILGAEGGALQVEVRHLAGEGRHLG